MLQHEHSHLPVIPVGLRRRRRPETYRTPSSILLTELRLGNLKGRACEDYCVTTSNTYGGMVAIIADGVSRSSMGAYPIPSPAALASERATLAMAEVLSNDLGMDPGTAMLHAFANGNQAVLELNSELGITSETVDFYANDYASCCGAAVTQGPDGLLTIGAIGDCQVQIFNLHNQQIFETPNFVAPLEAVRARLDYPKDEQMRRWRRDMRNHPEQPDTYGTLSGEPSALNYVHGFYYLPEPGDMILLHTDGIAPFTRYPQFIEFLRTGPSSEQLEQVINWYLSVDGLITGSARNDDKTLIAFQIN